MKKFKRTSLFEQNRELSAMPDREMSQDAEQSYTSNDTTSSPVSTPDGPQQANLTPNQNFSSGSMGGSIYSSSWTPDTNCELDDSSFDPCSGTMASQFTMINGVSAPNTCIFAGEIDITDPSNQYWYNRSNLGPFGQNGICGTNEDACIIYDTDSCKYYVQDFNATWPNACGNGCDWTTMGVGNGGLIFEGKYCVPATNNCEDQYDGAADYVTCSGPSGANCGGTGGSPGCCEPCADNYVGALAEGCVSQSFPNDPPDCQYTNCCTYGGGCLDDREDSSGTYLSTNTKWGITGAVGPGQAVMDCNGNLQLDCAQFSTPWGFSINNMNFGVNQSFSCCNYDSPNGGATSVNGCMEPGTPNYLPQYEFDCNHPSTTGIPPLQSGDPGFLGTYGNTDCCGIVYGCMISQSSSFNPAATDPCDDTNGPPCVNAQSGQNCCCDMTGITGCMDPLGLQYNANNILDCAGAVPAANTLGDTGCCGYDQGCMSTSAIAGYNPNAVADCGGALVISGNEYAANNGTQYHLWPSYNNATSNPTTIAFANADVTCCTFAINGCTDGLATNECQNGCNTDDGSCIYESCPDSGASNYMDIPFGGGTQYIPAAYMYNVSGGIGCIPDGGTTVVIGNLDCCQYPIAGCTDNTAFNYNAAATQDCSSVAGYPSGPPCLVDASGTLQTGVDCCCCYVEGCMDSTATNYDPNACSDDGSCYIGGCTHNLAWNYDSAATQDDGSCVYEGCSDATASNYNTTACYDVNGTLVPCGGCSDIDPTDPSATIDPANTGCCQYTVGCTDPSAQNQNANAQVACNTTGNISGTYWGNIGWPSGAGVIITPTNLSLDNECCTYVTGCMDENSNNYNSLAAISDPSLCLYTWGCKEEFVPGSAQAYTYSNYSNTAQYPCNDQPSPNDAAEQLTSSNIMWNGGNIVLPYTDALGISNPSYVNTSDNECCRLNGCTDAGSGPAVEDGAYNYNPFATANDGSCAYHTYGCVAGDATIYQNHNPNADGCAVAPNIWTGAWDNNAWDPAWLGPLAFDPLDTSCCVPVIPNTVTWACVNPTNDMGVDANSPPNSQGGPSWGECTDITNLGTFDVSQLLLRDAMANTALGIDPFVNGAAAGIDYAGTYIFQGDASVSFAIQQACNASDCGDCETVPVNGCSFCEDDGQLSDPCIQEANLYAAMEYVYDPSGPGYLSFNTKGECDNDPDCGIETHGCMNPNFCEFWTQVIQKYAPNGTVTEHSGQFASWVTMPYILGDTPTTSGAPPFDPHPAGYWQLGSLPAITDTSGCINYINPGCDDPGAANPNGSATSTCPNPYITAQMTRDKWNGTIDIPLDEIDWDGGDADLTMMTTPLTDPAWDCLYSCEATTFNGLPVMPNPEGVIIAGDSCWYCTHNGPQQSTDQCIEVGEAIQGSIAAALNTFNMAGGAQEDWFNDDSNCCTASFCCGTPTTGCMDDGTNNFGGEFDVDRAAAGWPVAGTSPLVTACNYDPAAIGVADTTACNYTCKGCMDPTAFNVGNVCDPNTPSTLPAVSCADNGPAPATPGLLVEENCCCCYVEGCMDPAALNYDPNACFENNGSCIYNAGYDCEIPTGATLGMCVPHTGVGTMGQFPGPGGFNACVASGCGQGRWKCNPIYKGGVLDGEVLQSDSFLNQFDQTPIDIDRDPPTGEVDMDAEKIAEQKVIPGGPNLEMQDMEQMDKDPGQQPDPDLSSLGPVSCCIEDPVGPWESEPECYDSTECIDCSHGPFWRCVDDPNQPRDVAGNYSGRMCQLELPLSPGWQWCLQNPTDPDCYLSPLECEGCPFITETWECEGDPKDPGGEVGITQGEISEQSTGLSIASNPCVQGGYDGWRTHQECADNTDCNIYTPTECFIGKTLIKMGDGTEKRIDEVEVGEEVLNDQGTKSTITNIQKHENSEIYGFNGGEAFVTKDHPLLVKTDGKNEWKSIDPEWVAPFSHGVDALRLEVGDILLKGENKEEMEVTSIEKEGVDDLTYNLVLDTVHTYYANDYIAHNAFFRNDTINENIDGVGGIGGVIPTLNPGWPIDFGCPCPDGTIAPSCCKDYVPPPPTPPSGGGTQWKCCGSNSVDPNSSGQSGIPVGGWGLNNPDPGYPGPICGNQVACCIPASQSCPYGSSLCDTMAPLPNGGMGYSLSKSACEAQCSPCVIGPINPAAPPQPGGGSGGGDDKGDGSGDGYVDSRKAQPKPEHSQKMSQWTKAVSDNSGQRVKFDGYGTDTTPLFLSPSDKKYTYDIISGDIFRIEGDSRVKIGNFVDKEKETVDVKPTERPRPTEKPQETPETPETPETKELKEQVLRMKKLMGL